VAEAAALAARAPVDLRVNTLRTSREKVLAHFARDGAVATPHSPVGIRLPPRAGWERAPAVTRDETYLRGHVELQDEGSQLAALLAGAGPGESVLDLCAGAGGKTLALSAAMGNRGQVHATDADAGQLAPIYERLKRAGTRNVQVHPPGADLAALAGRMDRVVVDAPCSGSGTWRRRPETKWRLTPEAVARRVAAQREILSRAVTFVRPGGILAYITCSVLAVENAGQVTALLAEREGLSPLDPAVLWAPFGAADAAILAPTGLTLTPARSGTDGFFVALLRRA
jgi:16S rRNA (cytosine967-C5)-methyltransferase